jgi:signal transduction histidine kinase
MINKLSIRTKFILIISLLLASVLALQFYFTSRVHRDIIAEIEQITRSFNRTTDAYFFGNSDINRLHVSKKELSEKAEHELLNAAKIKEMVSGKRDSLRHETEIEFTWNTEEIKKKLEDIQDEVLTLKIHSQMPPKTDTVRFHQNWNRFYKLRSESLENIHLPDLDSLTESLKNYEIQFNEQLETNDFFPDLKVLNSRLQDSGNEAGTFSFIIPDLSKPAKPTFLEYRYNADELNQVIRKMRNRNAFITLGLFALSIVGVVLIARRFSEPIRSLNASFDRVVQGDLSVSVTPSADDEIGELTRSFNTMVSELKKNKEKESLLQRKERLASLGQLAAGVAHEVKNPLNAINLTIEHLRDKFLDAKDDQASNYIETIQDEIRRLDKTVNNFLNYVRSENLERKPADMNALIDEILNLYERELASGRIRVKKKYAPGFVLNVDRERLKTALVNILLNAIQSVSGEGEITIETDADSRRIMISDTGCGIPEKDLEHIFDHFYTTKSNGTGLGLPTAYKIVKEHNGEITISSRTGQGTIVTLQLF